MPKHPAEKTVIELYFLFYFEMLSYSVDVEYNVEEQNFQFILPSAYVVRIKSFPCCNISKHLPLARFVHDINALNSFFYSYSIRSTAYLFSTMWTFVDETTYANVWCA